MISPAARRVAALLFVSGLCAVAYQTVWLRHLRLVFGASTAASAAVLAVFMAGLGAGSLILGRLADRSPNPLSLYARLEIAIALLAAASPWLIAAARAAYVALGGTPALGMAGGTLVRLTLACLVLGPPTFLMGGTLPAAIRAAAPAADHGRRTLGMLYGANTLGAVTGTLLVTFVAVEFLGVRKSTLVAALVNLLLGMIAQAMSRRLGAADVEKPRQGAAAELAAARSGFALAAGAGVGFAFFLMELVWYRLLGPILGGSSYTFGLILAVALAGIGIGGLAYGRGASARRPTLESFAVTCGLEALALALPYALGDRLAFAALVARDFAAGGFAALAIGWAALTAIVVLPAAIVAGYQFPLLVGALGSGREQLGRDVGRLYAWNTAGAIAGSLAGGFGLLPAIGALGAWRLVIAGLALLAVAAALVERRAGEWRRLRLAVVLGGVALLSLAARGPTAAWRHSGIGAGRFGGDWHSPNALRASFQSARSSLAWEQEGRESSVAVRDDDGHSFYINGKSDGNARGDAATQVMGGLVGSLLHPDPRSALVIGLGTGSTAGWLAAVPSIERVDVAEIEPAILRVAADCSAVNHACLRNPKVHVEIGDARELLQVGRSTYDIIFSEPSNPYRAGISSLFTLEFYRAAAGRLRPRGMFLQWLQGYDVDAEVVRTAFATLNTAFPTVEAWQLHGGDLLLVASAGPIEHDVARSERRVLEEPYRSALNATWGVSGIEGFYSGFLATGELARRLRQQAGGDLSTDDRPRIEFGFIRNLGRPGLLHVEDVRRAARGLRPATVHGELDWNRIEERRRARSVLLLERPAPWPEEDSPAGLRNRARIAYADGRDAAAAALWLEQGEDPEARADLLLVASGLAATGDPIAARYLDRLRGVEATEALVLEAVWRAARGERSEAAAALGSAFTAYREDPWPHSPVMSAGLNLALRLAAEDPAAARDLAAALAQPFAVAALERRRLLTRVGIADILRDGALCRDALEPLERAVPWDRLILEARVRCYGASDELGRRAARDLETYRAAEPRPLHGAGS